MRQNDDLDMYISDILEETKKLRTEVQEMKDAAIWLYNLKVLPYFPSLTFDEICQKAKTQWPWLVK